MVGRYEWSRDLIVVDISRDLISENLSGLIEGFGWLISQKDLSGQMGFDNG